MSKQIGQLPVASTPSGDEVCHVVQDGNSRRLSLSALAQWVTTAQSIVPVSSPWRGARATRTTAANIPGNGVITTVAWEAADPNTDSVWSAGSPTRLVVPAGVSKVRVTAGMLTFADTSGSIQVWVSMNGEPSPGRASSAFPRPSFGGVLGFTLDTGVLAVSPGDYFTLVVQQTNLSTMSITEGPPSFLCLEVVEALP